MKKSEKTELTREKILAAAVCEFGTKGFGGASVNNICKDNNISKGLIYHNFESKEDLYLHCVDYTFHQFIHFIKEQGTGEDMQGYMALRCRFFSENPLLSRIFFEAVLQPPGHLAAYIRDLKKELDECNLNIYRSALDKITLRPGITRKEALEYYNIIQEMFNGYFSGAASSGSNFPSVISEHETKLAGILDFMLYGIADGGKER